MRRIAALVLTIVVAIAPLAPVVNGLLPVYACLIPPEDLRTTAQELSALALVDVAAVGPSHNEQPPLPSPTPTSTLEPPPVEQTTTPGTDPSSSPTSTSTPWPTTDLLGYRADLIVVETYIGFVPSPLNVDRAARVSYELGLRETEAQVHRNAPCPPPAPAQRYQVGTRYLAAIAVSDNGIDTLRAWRVVGDDVLVSGSVLYLPVEVYQTHLAGIPANIQSGSANVTADRVPLRSLVAAIRAMAPNRNEAPDVPSDRITPPTTGAAGLKTTR